MVLQLRNSWQAAKISSAAVWWPVILMSHGFTVKEFMKSCQDFKCSCLVGNHPCVAWFYSWGKHDKLSKFQVLVAYHLSLAWCNSWVIHDMLSRFQVRLFGGLSSLCPMVLQLSNWWQAVKISSVAVWWAIIAMSHGFTVEEFMTSCQNFKCGCLVAYHPFVAWF